MAVNKLKIGLVGLQLSLSICFASVAMAAGSNWEASKISGPYNSGNLSVFFIHGKDQIKGQTYLTLQEALAQKQVVVHETGNVNELTVDNNSNSIVFIQSGDIVKGGRQDRTMKNDLLLQPRAKNVSLDAFCVEHGRWSQRPGEASDHFGSSEYSVSGKNLKLAAKKMADQSAVWSFVSQNQEKLSRNVAAQVAAPASPSSYELTLENKNVKEATDKLVKDLKAKGLKDNDVVGYAFAINGRINSADVYASHDLFTKLWPKLLNSSAVEAVSESNSKEAKPKEVTVEKVKRCLAESEKAPRAASYAAGAPNFEVVSKEDDKNITFSTVDKANGVSVHLNYMAK